MSQAMHFGSTKEETYSHISTYTSGSYYDTMRKKVLEMTELVLEKRIADGNRIISIADYGTADGVNVFPLLEEMIELIELKTMGRIETIIYLNDQVNNNFNLLHSNIAEAEFIKKGKTFVTVIGRSMFEQCLPTGSLDIALSSCAVHWLSKIPCKIENGLCYIHGSDEEKKLFKEQGETDWKNFILVRGRELKPGGFMAVQRSMTETDEHGKKYFSSLSEAWRNMYAEKIISKEEFYKAVVPIYSAMTNKDATGVFDDTENFSTGLRIESMKEYKHEMTPLMQIRNIKGNVAYADAMVDFTRPWLTNFINHGLSESKLSLEKEQITEEYFNQLKMSVLENICKLDYFHFQEVVVTKS